MTAPPVVGKGALLCAAYRLNCFAPPHLLSSRVLVLTTPLVVYGILLPEHQSVQAFAPYKLVTAELLKSRLVPP